MIGFVTLIAFVYKGRDTPFVAYRPSYKQIGHFMGHETVYCNFWIATWLRAQAVLFSLPTGVMGRDTVYLHDFSEVLKSWRDRNAN